MHRPRLAQNRFAAEHLSIQIRRDHVATVGEDDLANSGHDQALGGRTSHPTGASHQRRGALETQLGLGRQNARADLTSVALALCGRKLVE